MGKTQKQAILDWLMAGKRLTALEALWRFGCLQLSARIVEIEQEYGVRARRESEKTPSGKTVKRYWMDREQIAAVRAVIQ